MIYTDYHTNGNLCNKCPIVDGKLNGILENFSKDGIFRYELEYKNGICISNPQAEELRKLLGMEIPTFN